MKIDVIDPNNGNIIGVKDRKVVHTSGLWHNSVQANIIRLNDDILEILIQKRSVSVDISKNHFDQSCATQAKSGEKDMAKVLERGLKEELGITKKDYKSYKFNSGGRFLIKKIYKDKPLFKNNEILHLYLVKFLGKEIKPKSKRVSDVKWIPWNLFVQLSKSDDFTKTVKMYTQNSEIKTALEKAMYNYLKFDDPKDKSVFNLKLHSFAKNRFYKI